MATFVATRSVQWAGTYKNVTAGLLTPPTSSIGITESQDYTNGSGANQANAWHAKTRSLVSSTPETLDLEADLTDDYGTTLVFTEIKEIWVVNRSSTSGQIITLSGDMFKSFAGNGTYAAIVPAGGDWHAASPIDGFTVANGTDQHELTVTPGAYAISYDLIIAGVV